MKNRYDVRMGRRGGFESWVIEDLQARVSAEVIPGRGGLLVSLKKEGQEFLYINEKNLFSKERPRCGVPVLFPCCGRNEGDRVKFHGKWYPMPIHGFAHTSRWTVESVRKEEQKAALTISLTDSEETRKYYPYEFQVELEFCLEDGALNLNQSYRNTGTEELPYDCGFHPYFQTEDLDRVSLLVGSRSEEIRLRMNGEAEAGLVFREEPFDVVFHDWKSGHRVSLSSSPDFNNTVIWSVAGKPFVCVEPWQGLPGGFEKNTCRRLKPGETHRAWIKLEPELRGADQ